VKLPKWFSRLFAGFRAGPPPTSQRSSSPSKASSTKEPSTTAKVVASKRPSPSAPAKSYHETRSKTPNVSPKPITPKAVVLHHSGGSYAGGVAWIKNSQSRVSYHCLVAPDGRRTVFAIPTQRTWHAGRSEWRGRGDLNSWSVGAAFAGNTWEHALSEDAMASMCEYLVPVMREYGLTIADVTDHRTVSPGRKDDLRPIELERFLRFLSKRL